MLKFLAGFLTASVLGLSAAAGYARRAFSAVIPPSVLNSPLDVLVRQIAFYKNATEAAKHGLPPTITELTTAHAAFLAAGLPSVASVVQNPSLALPANVMWPGTATNVATYVNQALINYSFRSLT